MKRRRGRNIGWLKDFAAILIFLLLFPYFAFSFKEQKDEFMGKEPDREEKQMLQMYEELSDLPHNESYYVLWREHGVVLRLPVEHFLVGALASSIAIEYEDEILKAQAVILRSSLMEAFNNAEKKQDGTWEISIDESKVSYWTDAKMQDKWGESYQKHLKKCLDVVMQTQGIYLTYKGEPIKGYYHGMSAGTTRSAHELSEGEQFGYLRKNVCPENLSDNHYLQKILKKKKEVGELKDAQVNPEGYLISVSKNGVIISGENLKNELGAVSSNITWREEGENYVFMTKGQGHGFGLDQYYGNVLAGEGMSYREIINYFFADVVFQRME